MLHIERCILIIIDSIVLKIWIAAPGREAVALFDLPSPSTLIVRGDNITNSLTTNC